MPEPELTDAELADVLDAEEVPAKADALAKAEAPKPKTAADALKTALAPLAHKAEQAMAVAARGILDVQPPAAYVGGSELVLSEQDEQKLKELSAPTDDDIDIRPDGGMVYVTHMFYRRILTEVFGRGQWCEIPASPPDLKRESGSHRVYQAWQLKVRGCFIRSSVGSSRYFPDSPTANLSDALESACSDALVRNAAKGSLGIATEPWIRKEREVWKKKYAIQVFVRQKDGRQEMMWRRADADPLIGEIGPVKSERKPETKPQTAKPAPTMPVPEPETPLPAVEEAKQAPEPAPVVQKAKKPPSEAPKPEKATEPPAETTADMVQDLQIRLFFALCRKPKCKLIEGENAGGAVAWLAEQVGWTADKVRPLAEGKKSSEVVVKILRSVSMVDWREKILPNLRKQYGI